MTRTDNRSLNFLTKHTRFIEDWNLIALEEDAIKSFIQNQRLRSITQTRSVPEWMRRRMVDVEGISRSWIFYASLFQLNQPIKGVRFNTSANFHNSKQFHGDMNGTSSSSLLNKHRGEVQVSFRSDRNVIFMSHPM